MEKTQPPDFLKLIGHNVRWQIVSALARSDRRVHELVEMLERPQNLVSYHLQRLRDGGLVSESRSVADRRRVYYHLDLDRVRSLYAASGQALHPGLAPGHAPDDQGSPAPASALFLCTHNSARSQMAEGIYRARAKESVQVFSAGTDPSGVHPLAIRAMDELGIDIRAQRSRHLETFRGRAFDTIITVCDLARENCPVFPGDPEQIHWSIPDPAAVEGPEEVRYAAFRQAARQLHTRIGYLLLLMRR